MARGLRTCATSAQTFSISSVEGIEDEIREGGL